MDDGGACRGAQGAAAAAAADAGGLAGGVVALWKAAGGHELSKALCAANEAAGVANGAPLGAEEVSAGDEIPAEVTITGYRRNFKKTLFNQCA